MPPRDYLSDLTVEDLTQLVLWHIAERYTPTAKTILAWRQVRVSQALLRAIPKSEAKLITYRKRRAARRPVHA